MKNEFFGELDELVLSGIVHKGKHIDKSITPCGEITAEDPDKILDKMDYCRETRKEMAERYFRSNPD